MTARAPQQMPMRVSITLVVAAVWLLCARPAAAQHVPYAEISGGYNFMRIQEVDGGTNFPAGGYGDVAVNLNHVVGLVAVTTFSRPVFDTSVVSIVGGARFSARGFGRGPGRAIGFFQLLGGLFGTKSEGTTYIERAFEAGGGANVTFSNQGAVRLEADYIRTVNEFDPTVGENFLRFSVGVVYGFGSH